MSIFCQRTTGMTGAGTCRGSATQERAGAHGCLLHEDHWRGSKAEAGGQARSLGRRGFFMTAAVQMTPAVNATPRRFFRWQSRRTAEPTRSPRSPRPLCPVFVSTHKTRSSKTSDGTMPPARRRRATSSQRLRGRASSTNGRSTVPAVSWVGDVC